MSDRYRLSATQSNQTYKRKLRGLLTSDEDVHDGDDRQDWAYEYLSGTDLVKAEQRNQSPADAVREKLGIDPRDHDTRAEFEQLADDQRRENESGTDDTSDHRRGLADSTVELLTEGEIPTETETDEAGTEQLSPVDPSTQSGTLERVGAGTADQPQSDQLADSMDQRERWAFDVLAGDEIKRATREQLSPGDVAKEKTGVDPRDCRSKEAFLDRIERGEI